MVCPRRNIAHVMQVVSRYMADLGMKYWEARVATKIPKRHFMYGTLFNEIRCYFASLVNASFGDDVDKRKSTSSYVSTLGRTAIN